MQLEALIALCREENLTQLSLSHDILTENNISVDVIYLRVNSSVTANRIADTVQVNAQELQSFASELINAKQFTLFTHTLSNFHDTRVQQIVMTFANMAKQVTIRNQNASRLATSAIAKLLTQMIKGIINIPTSVHALMKEYYEMPNKASTLLNLIINPKSHTRLYMTLATHVAIIGTGHYIFPKLLNLYWLMATFVLSIVAYSNIQTVLSCPQAKQALTESNVRAKLFLNSLSELSAPIYQFDVSSETSPEPQAPQFVTGELMMDSAKKVGHTNAGTAKDQDATVDNQKTTLDTLAQPRESSTIRI